MSRPRVLLIIGVCVVALIAAGFGVHALQTHHAKSARTSAIKAYVTKVGPATRSLYASWTAYEKSIGSASGADEDAVRQSRATALGLQQLLTSLQPPASARVFHDEMSDIVKDILVVIEDRLRLVLTTPQPAERQQIQAEGGNAFYIVKQTFPDAVSQLETLDKIVTGP